MPTADEFRMELIAQIARATKQSRPHVEINAGELHRTVGGYPGSSHNMPTCCSVMRSEYEVERDVIVHETASGNAPALTIRYFLPR